uniref:Uncharacterized protein n=1 Tax=Glossina pallidipes TaxID=7398 RepID=A0A1A9Z858_GLOPL
MLDAVRVRHAKAPSLKSILYLESSISWLRLVISFVIARAGQFQLAGISYQAFIYAALNTCLRKVDTSAESYDYNRADTRALKSTIAACDLKGIYNTSDVDDEINILSF